MTIQTNKTATTETNYFNGVLYARVFINEVKLIQPKSKKAKQYCAINATIVEDENGVKNYTTIDLTVKGQKAKELLWSVNDKWPANRFERNDELWIADVNIGSIGHCGFGRKNGQAGAALKGRLINIRSLRIGSDVVYGEMGSHQNPSFVSPAYISLIDTKSGSAKASLLEGKVGEHDYQNIDFTFAENDAFNQLEAMDLCPKGYEHRDTNASVFAMLEFSSIQAIGYKKDDDFKSFLSGKLAKVRYLKADDKVINLSADVIAA